MDGLFMTFPKLNSSKSKKSDCRLNSKPGAYLVRSLVSSRIESAHSFVFEDT